MSNFVPPQLNLDSFHCPHCGVFAHQLWYRVHHHVGGGNWPEIQTFKTNMCCRCHSYSIWYNDRLIFPDITTVPPCHDETPPEVKADIEEARTIASKSPRGAAALLRLALQKLMVHLGEKGGNIHDDIGSLVSKGLPADVQMALDSVRVIGNNMVHPGVLNGDDTPELVNRMFSLLNFIVDNRITQPRKLAELYTSFPETILEGIQKRDSKPT